MERAYHWNMELMASESSTLDVLSMQHVSTQAQAQPPRWACRQQSSILRKPFFFFATGRSCMTWYATSSSPHV